MKYRSEAPAEPIVTVTKSAGTYTHLRFLGVRISDESGRFVVPAKAFKVGPLFVFERKSKEFQWQ